MMREIKFRGKRIDNGEWAYGYYCKGRFKPFQHCDCNDLCDCLVDGAEGNVGHEVDPATVGQYTGLKDKNGVEIYEGDIVRYMNGRNFVVEWSNGGYAGWQLRHPHCVGGEIWNTVYGLYYHGQNPWAEEVIGNIYQNPELLKANP